MIVNRGKLKRSERERKTINKIFLDSKYETKAKRSEKTPGEKLLNGLDNILDVIEFVGDILDIVHSFGK